MFTGIIESLGKVTDIKKEQSNIHITIESPISNELKIDQSLAHSGVCLTVVNINKEKSTHTVTAIDETLKKSNFQYLKVGDFVNLERAMKLNDRLDGHIVQGHVDQTGTCLDVENEDGSWLFTFKYNFDFNKNITIEKGSISVNGVSLTVVDSKKDEFSVAIIPYTFENTNFNQIKKGTVVNLEFDVIGKYISRISSLEK
ncbi:MAG: riboflavin synthase [Flavobacteriaceae bacterium]|jgi:riboflavin synthase